MNFPLPKKLSLRVGPNYQFVPEYSRHKSTFIRDTKGIEPFLSLEQGSTSIASLSFRDILGVVLLGAVFLRVIKKSRR